METIEIRPAVNRQEVEQAYDIWGTVFPEDRSFFQERLDLDADYALDTTWLAFVNGRLAAAVQLFPYRMRWGSVELKAGGIGNVATLPEFRRRGLAQQLLRRQCGYMRTRGYDLSLLMTGINPFYEQLGWRTVTDQEWAADAAELRSASDPEGSGLIRRFTEADLDQVSRIYDRMDLDAVAPRKRSKEYWRGQTLWKTVRPENFLVAEYAGSVVAYLRYKTTAEHQLHVVDCGYGAGQDQAAVDLLRHAAAVEKTATVVKAALPSGHALEIFLQQHGAGIEDVTFKMWRSFDLNVTLRKIAPELERRLGQADEPGAELPASILFSVEGEEAVLTVKNGTVDVTPVGETVTYQAAIEMTAQQWLVLLLKGYEALEKQGRTGLDFLHTLFPKRPYIFWPADHF
jgi:predicted acetyltransferase